MLCKFHYIISWKLHLNKVTEIRIFVFLLLFGLVHKSVCVNWTGDIVQFFVHHRACPRVASSTKLHLRAIFGTGLNHSCLFWKNIILLFGGKFVSLYRALWPPTSKPDKKTLSPTIGSSSSRSNHILDLSLKPN